MIFQVLPHSGASTWAARYNTGLLITLMPERHSHFFSASTALSLLHGAGNKPSATDVTKDAEEEGWAFLSGISGMSHIQCTFTGQSDNCFGRVVSILLQPDVQQCTPHTKTGGKQKKGQKKKKKILIRHQVTENKKLSIHLTA